MIRKLLAVVLLLASVSAPACETRTYIIDGRMIVCTVCLNITTCN